MKLCVDVGAGRAQLEGMVLEGQWVDFYALLALTRVGSAAPDQYLHAEELARVGPWRHKAVKSVGKEVARHLDKLARSGLGDALEHRGRTQCWRLSIPPDAVALRPDPATVRDWLSARSVTNIQRDGYADGLSVLVQTMVELSKGRGEAALRLLDEPPESVYRAEPSLAAWGALLRGRALYQQDDDESDEPLVDLQDEWSRRADAPGQAVGARLRAFVALRYRFEDAGATLASLSKLASDLEMRGDIGSLAAVLNVMGLLSRRAGAPQAGCNYHLRAAALFGLGGDCQMLQAALFNLALCRREALAQEGLPPDEDVLVLVDLCMLVCARYGVGGDSAQAELSGAEWANEMHQADRARRYLEHAEKIIVRLDSTFEQACFLEVRAEVDLAHPRDGANPSRDLRTAEALFAKVGDAAAAARVRRRMRAVRG